jgi:hypothetical protein
MWANMADEEFAEETTGDKARIARVERTRQRGEFGKSAGVERRPRHRGLACRKTTAKATAKATAITPP